MRFLLIGRGKMGSLIAETARANGDEVAAALGRRDLDAIGDKKADVVIDFSRPEALPEIASYIRHTGTPLLSGTTGFSPAEKTRLEEVGQYAPVLWSANFSLGVAVLYAPCGRSPASCSRTSTLKSRKLTTSRKPTPPAAPPACWRRP